MTQKKGQSIIFNWQELELNEKPNFWGTIEWYIQTRKYYKTTKIYLQRFLNDSSYYIKVIIYDIVLYVENEKDTVSLSNMIKMQGKRMKGNGKMLIVFFHKVER